MEVLNFHFRNHSYCVEVSRVAEVLDTTTVMHLPGAPPAFEGLFQVRGRIVNLLNFSLCFGDDCTPGDSSILVFGPPMNQFAIRVPDPVDVQSLDFNSTQFPERSSGIVRILEGTVSDGENIHHLISLDRLLAYATDLVEAWRNA
jgi:chemotaxis signal transduction protein